MISYCFKVMCPSMPIVVQPAETLNESCRRRMKNVQIGHKIGSTCGRKKREEYSGKCRMERTKIFFSSRSNKPVITSVIDSIPRNQNAFC